MRYFALIRVPIQAEKDEIAIKKAEQIRKMVEIYNDNTELVSIAQKEFGSTNLREIDVRDFIF